MKTQVVQVLIRRDLTSAPAHVVQAHEVPILKIIKGHGNVEVTDANCRGYDMKPFELQPRNEFIRLKTKYKGFVIDGQHPVDVAYPDGSRDLELFYKDPDAFNTAGMDADELADTDAEGRQVLVMDDELNEVDETVEEAPEPTESEPVKTLDVPNPLGDIDPTDRPAIVKELNELTVPFAKTVATKHLATLLAKSREAAAAE